MGGFHRGKYEKSPHHNRGADFVDLLQAKSLVEPINASTGIDQLLLASVEGMALGADFNLNVLLRGTGRENVATGTADRSLFVLGMDTFLHVVSPLSARVSKGVLHPLNQSPDYNSTSRGGMQGFFSLFSGKCLAVICGFALRRRLTGDWLWVII